MAFPGLLDEEGFSQFMQRGAPKRPQSLEDLIGQVRPVGPGLGMTPDQLAAFGGGRVQAQPVGPSYSMPKDELLNFLNLSPQQADQILSRSGSASPPKLAPAAAPAVQAGPSHGPAAGYLGQHGPMDAGTFEGMLNLGTLGTNPGAVRLGDVSHYLGTAVTPEARAQREAALRNFMGLGQGAQGLMGETRQMHGLTGTLGLGQQTENRLGAEAAWKMSGERNWDFVERDMRQRGATGEEIRIARQRWLEDHPGPAGLSSALPGGGLTQGGGGLGATTSRQPVSSRIAGAPLNVRELAQKFPKSSEFDDFFRQLYAQVGPEELRRNAPMYREFLTNYYGDAPRDRVTSNLFTQILGSPATAGAGLVGLIPGLEGARNWARRESRMPVGESLRRATGRAGRYEEEQDVLRSLLGVPP